MIINKLLFSSPNGHFTFKTNSTSINYRLAKYLILHSAIKRLSIIALSQNTYEYYCGTAPE